MTVPETTIVENGTAAPCVLLPLPLAQQIMDILVQLPYGQVADVANELRTLQVEEPR